MILTIPSTSTVHWIDDEIHHSLIDITTTQLLQLLIKSEFYHFNVLEMGRLLFFCSPYFRNKNIKKKFIFRFYGTMPNSIKCESGVYKNQPGRIENYVPGHSSVSDKERKEVSIL